MIIVVARYAFLALHLDLLFDWRICRWDRGILHINLVDLTPGHVHPLLLLLDVLVDKFSSQLAMLPLLLVLFMASIFCSHRRFEVFFHVSICST